MKGAVPRKLTPTSSCWPRKLVKPHTFRCRARPQFYTLNPYRGTLITRNCPFRGPYSRTIPMLVLVGGGGVMSDVPLQPSSLTPRFSLQAQRSTRQEEQRQRPRKPGAMSHGRHVVYGFGGRAAVTPMPCRRQNRGGSSGLAPGTNSGCRREGVD